MKILALVTDAFGGLGGIAQYNRDVLTALAQCANGGRIVVLPRLGRAGPTEIPLGVQQLEPKASKIAYGLAAFRAAVTGSPFDAVFCGHLHLAPLGMIVAQFLGAPLWLQLHGFEAWERLTKFQGWSVGCATLVTAVSRYTRRRFLRIAHIDPNRVRVLPNTVDARFIPGPKPDYLLDRHHLHGRQVLLTVSRLAVTERLKGHDKVIEALPGLIKRHPGLIYLVAGEGEDRKRLENLTQRLGIADNVLFLGKIDPNELAEYYRLADVFLMPSMQEGFGIVFLEAAASGLTVIGGNCDGSVDALADGAIGTAINPADRNELARVISEALAARAPHSGGVGRFKFENFARQVCELVSSDLLRSGVQIKLAG
jgi:phosphatidyl-myo-inositol dimannoside synthase